MSNVYELCGLMDLTSGAFLGIISVLELANQQRSHMRSFHFNNNNREKCVTEKCV